MSQSDPKAAAGTTTAAGKTALLCKTFTEQAVSQNIDPQWLLLQLQTAGLPYRPQTPMAIQARAFLIEDIKLFLSNYFNANGIDIETDEATAKQINTWFEASLVKTNPYLAQMSGVISQERMNELMGTIGGMGMMNPFMGGGMGMPGMSMGMPGMMGGMGMGMPMGMGGNTGAPIWKKTAANQQQKPQQPQNPFMMGMGGMNPMMMGGMNPMMMGGMNPMMMGGMTM